MKVELSKREIEVILELMELGITFSITHDDPEFVELKTSNGSKIPCRKTKEKVVNTNELKSKLRELLSRG